MLFFLESFPMRGAIVTAFIGGTVLAGWLFNIETLKSVVPGLTTMKVNTALSFVMAGSALWALQFATVSPIKRVTGLLLAVGIVAIAGLTLTEYIREIDLGIDEFLWRDDPAPIGTSHPGRMSPATALNFLLSGIALLALGARRSWSFIWISLLTSLILFISFFAVLGYMYGVGSLYQVSLYTAMAVHTAVTFCILSLALIAANTQDGFMKVLVSDTAGGLVARHLVPMIPLLLLGLGWLRLQGQEADLYDTRFGLALMVGVSMIVTTLLVGWQAKVLHDVDLTRQGAEAEKRQQFEDLQRANRALERSNLDLQRFAYAASHELQTPLRSISGFIQLIEAKYAGRLDEQADDWIRRTVQATRVLQTLIRDLLAYSRLDSQAHPFEHVSFRSVFDDVIRLLDAPIRNSRAQITCGELPTVMGDRSQLVQLMQNLISNALKYCKDTPCVHVSAECDGTDWVFSVRDNGIGIDPKYHERIFEIFQRLHNQQEYSGTGVGLAVCRHVVHRHDGRIWVEF